MPNRTHARLNASEPVALDPVLLGGHIGVAAEGFAGDGPAVGRTIVSARRTQCSAGSIRQVQFAGPRTSLSRRLRRVR